MTFKSRFIHRLLFAKRSLRDHILLQESEAPFAHGCWRSNRNSYVQKDAFSPFSARLHDGYLLAQNLTNDLPLSRTDLGKLFQTAHSFGYAPVCRGEILGDGRRSVTKRELRCVK